MSFNKKLHVVPPAGLSARKPSKSGSKRMSFNKKLHVLPKSSSCDVIVTHASLAERAPCPSFLKSNAHGD